MFTGIIGKTGKVGAISSAGPGKRIRVDVEGLNLAVGDSVAVDGACLTAEEIFPGGFTAYLSGETLKKTKFGKVIRPGYPVNLETPLTPDKLLSGHLVQGHVDTVGTVARLTHRGEEAELVVNLGPGWTRFLVEKGSVAVDGISLTAVRVSPRQFTVAVVAHTLKATTLQLRTPRSPVNLEFDLLAKYVERLLGKR